MSINPWEAYALEHNQPSGQGGQGDGSQEYPASGDPIIYPGLYCPSGFDMMNILVRVATRPNPKIDLGAVDASCALLLCDLEQTDTPIVYASDPFLVLTGYSQDEVIGRNCRFLQAPGGKVRKGSSRQHVEKDVLRKMRKAVEKNTEVQVEVPNFKKDGVRFENFLTIIPVPWDTEGYRYSVGFQVDKNE